VTAPVAGADARFSRAWCALFAVAIVTAVVFRAWQLDTQILIDDEWHAIHKLLHANARDIATHFGYADHSIPLTLYYRLLYTWLGLSEASMHAPMLVAGAALVIAAPLLARQWASWPTRAIWAALLACAPLLVYHSRIARPYAITSLLTFVAFLAFWRWRTGEKAPRGAAAWYVAATLIAGWMHPVTLPFTLSPFLFELAACIRRTSSRTLFEIVRLGLATALALAIVIVPPLVIDWRMFLLKAGTHSVTLESLYRTLLMLAGTAHLPTLAAFALLAAWGGMRLVRRDRVLVAYFATIAICGAAATFATKPQWIIHPLVAARYLIPILPLALLLVAEGIHAALLYVRWPSVRPVLAALLIVAWVLQGPLPVQAYWPNQFPGHLRFQFDYDDAFNPYVTATPSERVPAFYRSLATLPPGSRTLIEAPWRLESDFNPHPWYQRVHRQHIKIGFVGSRCGVRDFGEYPEDPRMHMRQFVQLDAILRGVTGGADYLVIHIAPWKTPPDATVEWPDMTQCLPAIESALGSPVYRDEGMVVFPLR